MINSKEINIKKCTCYVHDLDVDKILPDEKSYKNGLHTLHITFGATDGYIKEYDEINYLGLSRTNVWKNWIHY